MFRPISVNTHAQSQAQKSAAKKRKDNGDDNPKKPSDPKKPGDPKKPDDGKKPGREEDPGEARYKKVGGFSTLGNPPASL